MVSDDRGPASVLREGGNPDASAIPIKFLTLCGNDHGYNASLSPACPACGNYERIMVEKALGPEIMHRRILAALKPARR